MAKFSELMDKLADAIDWTPGQVRQFGRHAREGGYITTTGARGNAAPDANSTDAANLLIAMLGSEHAKEAAETIKKCRKLDSDSAPGTMDWISLTEEQKKSIKCPFIDDQGFLSRTPRLPPEFVWMVGGCEFGYALEKLIDMAVTGELQEVSKRKCEIYAFPRVVISVKSPNAQACIRINDQWMFTKKMDEMVEQYGDDLDVIAKMAPSPIIEQYFVAGRERVAEDFTAKKSATIGSLQKKPRFDIVREINQSVIERIGEIIRN